MTIAELHGKISSSGSNLHEKMEDLLTSDVFSACKYLPPEALLLPFLCTARSPDGRSLEQVLPNDVDSAAYRFWPMLSGCEPDLVITLHGPDGSCHLVMIEAKYLSEKSGRALADEEIELAVSPTDQLAREFVDLGRIDPERWASCGSFESRSLVCVTAHRSAPDQALAESVREIGHFTQDNPDATVYWTSWFQLASIVQAANPNNSERPITADLLALLERKQFTGFGGFDRLDAPERIPLGALYRTVTAGRSANYGLLVHPPEDGIGFYRSQATSGRRTYSWPVDAPADGIHFYALGAQDG